MRVFRAILRGLGLALQSPKLVLLLWLATFLLALPVAVIVGESIASSIGPSLVHEDLRGELELGWLGEYQHEAGGIKQSFSASSVSAAALFDNLEIWFTGELFFSNWGLVAVGGLFVLVWAVLAGGTLVHLRTQRPILRTARFLESGSKYFFRFVRLAAVSGPAYYLVYRFSRWLFPWVKQASQDVTVERTVLLYNLLAAAVLIFALTLIHMVFDYARIVTVLEERRSMVLSALRGLIFVLTHPVDTLAVYYGLGLLTAALPFVYFLVAPRPGGDTVFQVLLAFLVGQLFLAAKLTLRVALYGAQMALYESAVRRSAGIPSLGG